MTFDPRKVASALNRLFSTCPLPAANATPEEAVRVFFEVCQPFTTGQILDAVDDFINGRVPGINSAFAPTAPQFATHMRLVEKRQYDLNAGSRLAQKQIEEQSIDEAWAELRTPEAKAKVQSLLEAIKDQNKPDRRTPEEIQKAKDDLARQDQFFAEQFIESPSGIPVSKSLAALMGVTTYNTADDDKYDMGDVR